MSFFSDNSSIIVVVISMLIWIGLFLYLIKLDKRIKNLERKEK
jgi:CcmD family protein